LLSELYGNAYCVNANIKAFANATCDFIPIFDCRDPVLLEEHDDYYEIMFAIETTATLIVEIGTDIVKTVSVRRLSEKLTDCALLHDLLIQRHRTLYALAPKDAQALLQNLRIYYSGPIFPDDLAESTYSAFLALHSNTMHYCGLVHSIVRSESVDSDYSKCLLVNAYEEMARSCATPAVLNWISR